MEKKKKGKRKKKEKGNEEGAQRTRDKCLPELVYSFVFRKRFALAKMFARGSLKYLECFEEAGERILPFPSLPPSLSRPVAGKRTHPTCSICLFAALLFPQVPRPSKQWGVLLGGKAQTNEPRTSQARTVATFVRFRWDPRP